MKILNVKLAIILEDQNIRLFLQKAVLNCSEENFVIKKAKNIVPWTNVMSDLKGEETFRKFYKKE